MTAENLMFLQEIDFCICVHLSIQKRSFVFSCVVAVLIFLNPPPSHFVRSFECKLKQIKVQKSLASVSSNSLFKCKERWY